MKIIDSQGAEVLALTLGVEDQVISTHASYATGAAELDLPKATVSFESVKDGLLVHMGMAETDKSLDVLLEYADAKTLKEVPGKGLVSFMLKAFR